MHHERKAMKTNYTIKNFRAFDRKGAQIEISPLTFLVGCNSSGKSSFVKSLFLLKEFFGRKTPVIGTKIDFSTYPICTLGTFRNAVHSSSKDKTITISYDKYSVYLNDTITTSLSICEGALGNGYISGIKMEKQDGTILFNVPISGSHFMHISALKSSFKQFLRAAMGILNLDYLELATKLEAANSVKKILADKEEILRELLQSYSQDYLDNLYSLYKAIEPNNKLFGPFDDNEGTLSFVQYISTDIMMYFSIMHELDDAKNADELRKILRSKVIDNKQLSGEERDVLYAYIDAVCQDYRQSNKNSFLSYYKSLEDDFIKYDAPRFLGIIKSEEDFPDYLDLLELSPEFVIGDIENLKFVPLDYEGNITRHPKCVPTITLNCILDRFGTVHGLLSFLSPGNPFSYSSQNEAQSKTARHPLYLETFKEYIDLLLKDILCVDITEGIDYISSSRIQVRRMYPMEDNTEFTSAVKRYYDIQNKFLSLDPPITVSVMQSRKGDFGEEYLPNKRVRISDFMPGTFMNKWVKAFKIGDRLSLEMEENGLGLLVKLFTTPSDKKGRLLADAGYGITQFLSIVLQIEITIMSSLYECFKGKTEMSNPISSIPAIPARTIAIEEPEIHLHPKYQSLLAEMFYEAYKEYNIQFIIETHSEYLLRKIQTLVGARNLSPEEVAMVYVEDDEEVKKGAQKVRRIPVKDDGRLAAPFGPGFYDEAGSLSRELLKNAIEQKGIK